MLKFIFEIMWLEVKRKWSFSWYICFWFSKFQAAERSRSTEFQGFRVASLFIIHYFTSSARWAPSHLIRLRHLLLKEKDLKIQICVHKVDFGWYIFVFHSQKSFSGHTMVIRWSKVVKQLLFKIIRYSPHPPSAPSHLIRLRHLLTSSAFGTFSSRRRE